MEVGRNAGVAAVERVGVTPARQILPGQTVFITCRAVNRTYRFVPKDKVVDTIRYCLAATIAKYDVDVHEFVYMSNHFHLVLTARDPQSPNFMRDLNSLTSRALNALRGRGGTNIESHYNSVVAGDSDKVLDHCAYTLANPCAADLVVRADKWHGVTSCRMEYGEALTVERPKFGLWAPKRVATEQRQASKRTRRRGKSSGRAKHRGRSKMPERVMLSLVRPSGFDSMGDAELRDEVRRRVVVLESEAEAKRAKDGRRVLGMRRVKAQHWNDYPRQTESMFGPVPKASGSNRWARIEALQRQSAFQRAYRTARQAFIDGVRDVVFPAGTWQMRERFNVRCAAATP